MWAFTRMIAINLQGSSQKFFHENMYTVTSPCHDAGDILIVQDALHNSAPHYSVISGKKLQTPSGRENPFAAILIFIHQIREKKEGKFGFDYRNSMIYEVLENN